MSQSKAHPIVTNGEVEMSLLIWLKIMQKTF